MLIRFGRLPLVLFLLTTAVMVRLQGQTSFYQEEQILKQAKFHESVEVRTRMKETITAPFLSLLSRQKEIHEQILSPVAVEFELRKSAESFYLLFKNEQDYRYPVWGRGNYIIKRDLRTGDFLQIKIFLQNDENSFIRLFPLDENRSVLDLVLYGSQLYAGIVIPVSLEELSISSFTRLMHLTRSTIQWDLFLTDTSYYEWAVLSGFVDSLRPELEGLHETEDGAQNAAGRFVQIENGMEQEGAGGVNCSGFAKWVADGILLGLKKNTSLLIRIEDLKSPTESEDTRLKNPWSSAREDRDPYFGLDWTRNLARILKQAQGLTALSDQDALDVTQVSFFSYRENIGYNLENMRAVMYLLAIENPGAFYMGSINSLFGKDPVLWQYHHIALFFPWFTESGDFRLAVFETGAESSLDNLEARYPDSFVHLERVDMPGQFISPSAFESSASGERVYQPSF